MEQKLWLFLTCFLKVYYVTLKEINCPAHAFHIGEGARKGRKVREKLYYAANYV